LKLKPAENERDAMSDVIIVAGIVVVVLLLSSPFIVFAILRARKRSAEIKRMSTRMGLSFTEFPNRQILDALGQSFELFHRGLTEEFRDYLEGIADSHHLVVFGYSYGVQSYNEDLGGSKSTRTVHQNVAIIELQGKKLPQFQLGQEGLGKKIKGLVGMKDIEISHDEEFSRRFWLTGADSAAIESLFTPEVTGYFRGQQLTKAGIECDGSRILYYKVGRIEPAELQGFLDDAGEVARLFEKQEEY